MHTLVAISIKSQSIRLKFRHKDGYEVCEYTFTSKADQEHFVKQLLKLERELKQSFLRI